MRALSPDGTRLAPTETDKRSTLRMKKQLYPWQEDCLKKWFANRGRGMVQAVTGSGKTLLALTAAERLQEKVPQELRVKIVVPTSALMRQWERALKEFLADSCGTMAQAPASSSSTTAQTDFSGLSRSTTAPPDFRQEIGLRGAGFKSPADCKYMIYVINSARYELARQILAELKNGYAVLLIADECHRYESGQNRLIFEFLPYIKPYEDCFFSLGLSATLPGGQALQYLSSVLGRRIYNYGMKQAAAMHTICKYDIYHIALPFLPEEKDVYTDITDQMNYLFSGLLRTHPFLKDMPLKERYELLRTLAGGKNRKTAQMASTYINLSYKRKNLVCLASARISCACELIKCLPQAEKIIVFGERIRQAEELYTLLQKHFPGKVGRYHSRMGQQANRNTLNRFRDGSIRILIACKAIDEGLDVPDAATGIILSGTSMQRQRIQRLGRILRRADGKEYASLYYLHLEDTVEDTCFLPDAKETRLFELEYLPDTREFLNQPYDKAAEKLLSAMQSAEAGEKALAEVQRCLRLGSVRSDWLPGRCDADVRIKEAKYVSDKNYWICMKKLREL
ncbi:helicase C-terminal domain protein [Marvinbryantia formatexigens DSM 14469]|uniref:Helicase C-terminal domain protein n=2 Tax=Marvinbryantia TaxID=248744 RepID=C6LAS6_9FIRM|nr:helicase C-terminal domain protein [Marvinbryantia formatexigens DSM 14469]